MTVREFLRALWSGRWFLVASVILAVVGAYVYLDQQEHVYESEATVQVGGTADGSLFIAATGTNVTDQAVLEAAATALGTTVADLPEIWGEDHDSGEVVVRVRSTDRERVQEVTNAVAEAFAAHVSTIRDLQVEQLSAQRAGFEASLLPIEQRLAVNPEDVLAGVEKETIVAEFGSLAKKIVGLTTITTPARVAAQASEAEIPGLTMSAVLPVAALAGLVLGMALALTKRGLDGRVRDSAMAARLADAPVLASLFDVRAADKAFRRGGGLPVSSRDATPFTESIRELRTAVHQASGHPQHVVLVTASDRRPPRAFITANLAASFALSGLKTIAVSADLRRSHLDEYLPAPDGAQKSGTSPRPTRVPNLALVAVSNDVLDPADYLATTEVRDLIASLRDQADVVVIDGPPALAAADATILGQYADGVVLVAAAGRTTRTVLASAAERLRINNVPLVGVVLAGVAGGRREQYATTYVAQGPSGVLFRFGSRSSNRQRAAQPTEPAEASEEPATPAHAATGPSVPKPGAPPTVAVPRVARTYLARSQQALAANRAAPAAGDGDVTPVRGSEVSDGAA